MEKLCYAPDEMSSVIMRGFLESRGIRSTNAPDNRSFTSSGTNAEGQHAIYVEKDKFEEALRLIKEQGFIK